MKPKLLALGPATLFSMIALDLADDAEALALARGVAESAGRTVTVRRADGEIIETIRPSPKN